MKYKRTISVLLIGMSLYAMSPSMLIAESLGQYECQSLAIAAASFMSSRVRGESKDSLLNRLPSLEQPPYKKNSAKYLLLIEMHQMVEEVFAHDELDATTYMVFKSESCLKKVQGQEVVSYEVAYPQLKACSKLEYNDELTECSMNAAGAN